MPAVIAESVAEMPVSVPRPKFSSGSVRSADSPAVSLPSFMSQPWSKSPMVPGRTRNAATGSGVPMLVTKASGAVVVTLGSRNHANALDTLVPFAAASM